MTTGLELVSVWRQQNNHRSKEGTAGPGTWRRFSILGSTCQQVQTFHWTLRLFHPESSALSLQEAARLQSQQFTQNSTNPCESCTTFTFCSFSCNYYTHSADQRCFHNPVTRINIRLNTEMLTANIRHRNYILVAGLMRLLLNAITLSMLLERLHTLLSLHIWPPASPSPPGLPPWLAAAAAVTPLRRSGQMEDCGGQWGMSFD